MKMRVMALLALSAVIAIEPLSAQRAGQASNPFATAKVITCSFPTYAATRRSGPSVEVLTGTQDFSFQIDSFDFRRNRARLVATGTVPVSMLSSPTGLTIIEQTPAGNVNVTTVFSGGASDGSFLSVHSRHLGELDAPPRPSQAYGTCQAK
jgi:hypothetical protein